MKITVLSENHSVCPVCREEYGLSMLVEQGSVKLLFDTGTATACVENATGLGVSLADVTAVAFSHNHRDHCGGFLSVVPLLPAGCPVYAHTGFFRNKWWDHHFDPVTQETFEPAIEFVGPPFTVQDLWQRGVTGFRLLSDDVFDLGSGVYLLGNFPVPDGLEAVHPSSVMEGPDGELTPDTFRDEQVCVVRTGEGLVVLTGCAHNGILNILNTVEQRFPGERIAAIIGGTHLVPPSDERLHKTVDYLEQSKIPVIGACHCTGTVGLGLFSKQLQSYCETGSGSVFTFKDGK